MRALQVSLQVGSSRLVALPQVSGQSAPVLEGTVLTVPHPTMSDGLPAATPVAGGSA